MPFSLQKAYIGAPPVGQVDTTAKVPVGTIQPGQDPVYGGGEFIYLRASATIALGNLCAYDSNLRTALPNPATGGVGPLAVAMQAMVSGQFGWFQISGAAAVTAPNTMVPGADVFMLAATPGSVDDAAVAGEQVLGAKVSTTTGTPAAGFGIIQLNRPFMQGQIT